MSKSPSMDSLREKINQIDSKILKLLNQRLKYVQKIGQIKEHGQSAFYVPSRETKVYQRLLAENDGLLAKDSLKAIYREIMSASLALEKMLKIAYLGSQGTYTHSAAIKKFGASVDYESLDTIKDIFEEVARGRCDYGVVPIENSTEGAVTYTLDMFIDYDLKICSEVSLPINHHLMSKNLKGKIEKIFSNPQVFGQCRKWLHEHYPDAQVVHTDSTTSAAQMAKLEKHSAAIASELAAEIYGLNILNENIQDSASNVTRFLILGREFSKPTGRDKTSVVFSLKDEVGLLHKALSAFKDSGINMSKIESRPLKRQAWKYSFYIDLEGHFEDAHVSEALENLQKTCNFFKVLGSFPVEV